MSMHITTVSGADHPELKAFPAAKEGMQRFVIVLPHKERGTEDAFKVEIIPGKTMLTDGVNLVRLGTTIEPRTLNLLRNHRTRRCHEHHDGPSRCWTAEREICPGNFTSYSI